MYTLCFSFPLFHENYTDIFLSHPIEVAYKIFQRNLLNLLTVITVCLTRERGREGKGVDDYTTNTADSTTSFICLEKLQAIGSPTTRQHKGEDCGM